VFLFDEPLSNLDAALRGQTRVEIAKLHRELGATTIYVTHDQVEAMTLADRVVVLRDGAIEQSGSPLELYDRPANRFVAQFIGTPQMNMVDTAELPGLREAAGVAPATDGYIGIRPENVVVRPSGAGHLAGRVELVESLGADTLIYASVAAPGRSADGGVQLVARQNERSDLHPGDAVGLDIARGSFHVFDRNGRKVATASA
jgi:multiple sugar transport system ATP-binding protein